MHKGSQEGRKPLLQNISKPLVFRCILLQPCGERLIGKLNTLLGQYEALLHSKIKKRKENTEKIYKKDIQK